MNNFSELKDIIRFHRKKAKLTQKELADLAGLGKTTLFDIENGKQTVMFDSVLKLLHVLNIKLECSSPLMNSFWEQHK